jgi:cell wall assembly regulator SMI1
LDWHRRYDTPVAWEIQPGLSRDEILTRIKHLPFKMSHEFMELYQWRNGVRIDATSGDPSLFEFHRFLPLEEVLEDFKMSYPIYKSFYELADWLPVFQDPAGDGYGLFKVTSSAESAQVVFLMEGEGVQVVFDSLTQMMKTIVSCFEADVFTWRASEMETDFEAMGEVAARLNPNIRYWRDYNAGG